jgi:hypothetical protein
MKSSVAVRIERVGALLLLLCSGGGLWWLRHKVDLVDASASVRSEQLVHLRVLADRGQQQAVRESRSLAAVVGILDGRSFEWQSRDGISFLVPTMPEVER